MQNEETVAQLVTFDDTCSPLQLLSLQAKVCRVRKILLALLTIMFVSNSIDLL